MKPNADLLFLDGAIYPCQGCKNADMLWYSVATDKFFCSKCFNNLGGLD